MCWWLDNSPNCNVFSKFNRHCELAPISNEDHNSSKLPWSKFFSLIKGKWVQPTFRLECQNLSLINQLFISGCKTPLQIFNISKPWSLGDIHLSDQIRSVAQSCPILCDPMNRSMPGLAVHHQLPEFTETHIHWVSDAIQPSHPLSSPSPLAPNPSQHQSLFQWVNSSHEVAKVLEFQL